MFDLGMSWVPFAFAIFALFGLLFVKYRIEKEKREYYEEKITDYEEKSAKETCMCGNLIEGHGIFDGHSPVSMYDYYKDTKDGI